MAERELRIRVVGDAASGRKALDDTAKAADKVHPASKLASDGLGTVKDKLLGMVPGGQHASQVLEVVKGSSVAAGGALSGALVGGAVAGAAAIAALAVKGIGTFTKLAAEVDDFQDVAGGSTEDASRMVVALRELGISSETGAKGMFKLSREVEAGAPALAKYGIEVAKNKDGTTDLQGTLLNVADAYNKTDDQAKKNAIAFAAFGKSGTQLIDVLEQGRGGIEKFWKEADKHGEVLSDKDLESAKEYRIAMASLNEAFSALGIELGKNVVPLLSDFAEGVTDAIDGTEKAVGWLQKLAGAFEGGTRRSLEFSNGQFDHKKAQEEASKGVDEHGRSIEKLTEAQAAGVRVTDEMTDADLDAAEAAKETARASKLAADEQKRRTDIISGLLDAQSQAINSDMAFRDAEMALSDANQTLAEKQVALNAAIKDHGAKSAEARQATIDLQKAQQDAVGAVVADAEAFVKLKEDQAAANGQTVTAQQQHDLLRQRLQDLANALGPNSPLRSQLQGYIDQLRSIPTNIQTRVTLTGENVGGGLGLNKQKASGGPASGLNLVGERGPELVDVGTSAHVYNAAETRAMLSGGGSASGTTNYITIHMPAGSDGSDVIRKIKEYERRNGTGWRN